MFSPAVDAQLPLSPQPLHASPMSPRAVSSHPRGGERPQSSRAPCLIANGG